MKPRMLTADVERPNGSCGPRTTLERFRSNLNVDAATQLDVKGSSATSGIVQHGSVATEPMTHGGLRRSGNLMEVKTCRFADISSIGVEHDLPRSYTTIEKCKAMGQAFFSAGRVIRTEALPGTTAPNAITSLAPRAGVFQIGGGASVIDGVAKEVPVEPASGVSDPMGRPTASGNHLLLTSPVETAHPQAPKDKPPNRSSKLVRPRNLKHLK